MAGQNIGTIFVELDLDASRYVGAQKRLLQDATATTLNIESNFKKLGVRSSAEFDLMRQKATNAFERIKNSSQVTANDIVRAEKAKNEQLKRLNEQQFGVQKSLLQSLKDNWIAATGAIVAAWYTVNKVISAVSGLALATARYDTLGVSMITVGRNAGYASDEMDKFQKGLEETGISMSGARQALTRMAQAQLDLTYSSKLARIAQDAAVIGAMNSTDAFNNLVYGIQTANVRVLRTIGINVSWEESYKKVADQTGRTTTSFTESEKAAIRLNAVIDAGKRITGTYEAAMGTAGKQLYSMERYVENLKVQIGEGLQPVLSAMVIEATNFMKSLNPADIKFMVDSIRMLAEAFWGLSKAILSIPSFVMKVAGAMQTEVTVLVDVDEIVKQNTRSWLEHSRALNEAEKNYLSLSAAAGLNRAPGPTESPGIAGAIGGDTTKDDKVKIQDLTDFWRIQYDERYEIQSNALQRMIELDNQHLEESKAMTADFWQFQIQGNSDAASRSIKIEKQQAKSESDLRKQGLDNFQYTLVTMMNLFQGHNKTLFEVAKVASIATAIINTYEGATKALAQGGMWGYAAAAAVVASGMAQVANIRAQSFDGGASGGAAGGAISMANTPTLTEPTVTTAEETAAKKGNFNIYVDGAFVDVQGDFLGDQEWVGNLAERISEMVENYDVTFIASHAQQLQDR